MLYEMINKTALGSAYGSGALKALQNNGILPALDLLVREAIQNSSDAALGVDDERYDVNFNVNKFVPSRFNNLLSSLTPVLNERYPQDAAMYLEIRDSRTSGLTGPTRLAMLDPNDHGNYFKLVFDTGKEQTGAGNGDAGGSWGYGKSVYYAVGIGLVVFYSQIKVGSGYEERLIVSLMENESASNSLLRGICSNSIGRAWWGKEDPLDDNDLLPVTDCGEIQEILDIFGLSRFKTGQTGTSIIIPYIDEDRLLEGIIPDGSGIDDDEKNRCFWKNSIADYLELAIQKWYAPKIFNKNLAEYSTQKWLAVRVNGNAIKNDDSMRPLFQLVQELYTTALSYNANNPYTSVKYNGIECVAVPSKRIEGGQSGHVAFIKISKDQLSPGGNMIQPYTYLRLFGKGAGNDPIVMFARTPGMILDYKIDGKWVKGLLRPEDENEFLFAFYVPNCGLLLKTNKALGEFSGISFGEYLRKCEKSDHMEWEDKSGLTIISSLKYQMVIKINERIHAGENIQVEGTTSKLSGKLGRKLLPKIGYGKSKGGHTGGSGGSGGGSKADNLEIDLTPRIKPDWLEIEYKLTFKNTRKLASFGLFVETETGVMDADAWEDDIGSDFPLIVSAIGSVSTYAVNSKNRLDIEDICTPNAPIIHSDYTTIELLHSNSGKNIAGFEVNNEITNAIVSGVLIIRTTDRKFVCTLKEIRKS